MRARAAQVFQCQQQLGQAATSANTLCVVMTPARPGSGTDLVADHGNIADSGQWPPSSQQPAASRCSSRCSAGQVSEGRKLGIRSGQAETGQHMLSWGSLSSALCWYTNTAAAAAAAGHQSLL